MSGIGITESLTGFKSALSASAAFKTWADVATTPEAAARIHTWDGDQDGDPIVIIAPGSGFTCELATLDTEFIIQPVVACEFSQVVAKSATNESVFDTLAAAVDAIVDELRTQTTWRIRGCEVDADTPARTKASSNTNFVYFRVNVYGIKT